MYTCTHTHTHINIPTVCPEGTILLNTLVVIVVHSNSNSKNPRIKRPKESGISKSVYTSNSCFMRILIIDEMTSRHDS